MKVAVLVSRLLEEMGESAEPKTEIGEHREASKFRGNAKKGRDDRAIAPDAVGIKVGKENSLFCERVEAGGLELAERFHEDEDEVGLFVRLDPDLEQFFSCKFSGPFPEGIAVNWGKVGSAQGFEIADLLRTIAFDSSEGRVNDANAVPSPSRSRV